MIRIFIAVLVALAIISIQLVYGGLMRTVFAIPGYFLISVAGMLGIAAVFWRRSVPPRADALLITLLTAGYLVWRALYSTSQDLSLFYTFLVASCAAVYCLFAAVVTSVRARYVFLLVLLAAAIGQVLIATVQFSSSENYWPLPIFSEQIRDWYFKPVGEYPRGHGLFLNANHLAWFLNVVAFLSLGVACIGRCAVWVKILFAYLAAVCLAGTVLTLSRGGMIGLCVGMAAFFALSSVGLFIGARDRRLIAFLVTLAAIAAGIGGGYLLFSESPTVQARMNILAIDRYRVELLPAALRQAQLEPIFGTGAGSFTQLSRRLRDQRHTFDDHFAHNDWAQLFADFGFVGLVLVGCAFLLNWQAGLTGFLAALRERMAVSSRPQSNSAAFAMGSLSALAACAAHSFFDFNMQIPANAILAAACAGMLANSGMSTGDRRSLQSLPRYLGIFGGCAAGVFLLILLEKSSRVEWQALLAENALILQDPPSAIIAAEIGLESVPNHSRTRRILGEALFQSAPTTLNPRETFVRSVYFLRRSIEGDPEERWNHLMLALSLASIGKSGAAETSHIEAIRLDPGSASAYEYYALFLEGVGRTPEAIRAYEASIALPGTKFAHLRLRALRQKSQKKQ